MNTPHTASNNSNSNGHDLCCLSRLARDNSGQAFCLDFGFDLGSGSAGDDVDFS